MGQRKRNICGILALYHDTEIPVIRHGMTHRIPVRLPPLFRLTTWAGQPLERLSPRFWGLSVEQLMARARKATGLSDFGDDAFREPMQRLIDNALTEGSLTLIGRMSLGVVLTQNLINRLRIRETLRLNPEILDIPIERPVFIVGWFRSGTTILHHLLALDPEARALPYWELQHPCPRNFKQDDGVDWRIKQASSDIALFKRLVPDFFNLHPLDAQYPEECQFLMDNYLPSSWYLPFQAMRYGDWILSRDMSDTYKFYRTQLQIILWQRPTSRLILKWPQHLWYLKDLIATFPDACIVQTHRDLGRVLPSVCAMSKGTQSAQNHHIEPHKLGAFWLKQCQNSLERAQSARRQAPEEMFYDCHHSILVKDQISELKRIYDHFGFQWSEVFEARVRDYLQTHPPASSGPVTLEEFGLNAQALKQIQTTL